MKIGIVGEADKNGLSHKTYDSILKVKNSLEKNESLHIDLILLEASDINLDNLPCDQVFVYDQLTGDNQLAKSVHVIEHYYWNNMPSLIVVALKNHMDCIIPSAVIKINATLNPSKRITSFLECDHVLVDQSLNKVTVMKAAYGGNVLAHYSIKTSAILSFNHAVKSKLELDHKTPNINYVAYKNHFDNPYINRVEIDYIKDGGLDSSDFVVVCGKGVGSKNAVEDIVKWAESMGAVVGGSKKVIDHGWLSIHQLIGQTGHRISPKICLLLGVSGASAFVNGIIGSKKIIAINTDKNARIFDYADIGVVEDFKVVLEALKLEFNVLENK